MEQHLAIKKNTATCIGLENIKLSEVSQIGKYRIFHSFTFKCLE